MMMPSRLDAGLGVGTAAIEGLAPGAAAPEGGRAALAGQVPGPELDLPVRVSTVTAVS